MFATVWTGDSSISHHIDQTKVCGFSATGTCMGGKDSISRFVLVFTPQGRFLFPNGRLQPINEHTVGVRIVSDGPVDVTLALSTRASPQSKPTIECALLPIACSRTFLR
jgi:hypothetical protein